MGALTELRDADNLAIVKKRVRREKSPAEQFIKLSQHR